MAEFTNGSSNKPLQWKRPENVPFPTVWLEFEGKVLRDGKRRKYWIQDITDEWMGPALYWLEHGLMLDEPLCKYVGMTDRSTVECAFSLWKMFLDQRLGVICLTKDDDGKVIMAGLNYLCRFSITDEKNFKASDPKMQKVLDIMGVVGKLRDPFKEQNVTEYLSAMGLFVLPEFRGESLGLQILKAREPLCRAMGFKVTFTYFSSIISQKLATRCGFKVFAEMDYEEINAKYPHLKIENIMEHTKTLKSMYWEIN